MSYTDHDGDEVGDGTDEYYLQLPSRTGTPRHLAVQIARYINEGTDDWLLEDAEQFIEILTKRINP